MGGFSWKGKLGAGGQLRSTGELTYNELASSCYLERMDCASNLTSASWSATASLSYGLHTTKFTRLKFIIQWSLVRSLSCATITTIYVGIVTSCPKETLCPLAVSPTYSAFSQPWATANLLPVCGFASSRHFTSRESHHVWSSVPHLFHVAQCFQGSSTLWHESGLYSFLWPNSILPGTYGYPLFSPSRGHLPHTSACPYFPRLRGGWPGHGQKQQEQEDHESCQAHPEGDDDRICGRQTRVSTSV